MYHRLAPRVEPPQVSTEHFREIILDNEMGGRLVVDKRTGYYNITQWRQPIVKQITDADEDFKRGRDMTTARNKYLLTKKYKNFKAIGDYIRLGCAQNKIKLIKEEYGITDVYYAIPNTKAEFLGTFVHEALFYDMITWIHPKIGTHTQRLMMEHNKQIEVDLHKTTTQLEDDIADHYDKIYKEFYDRVSGVNELIEKLTQTKINLPEPNSISKKSTRLKNIKEDNGKQYEFKLAKPRHMTVSLLEVVPPVEEKKSEEIKNKLNSESEEIDSDEDVGFSSGSDDESDDDSNKPAAKFEVGDDEDDDEDEFDSDTF